MFAAPGRIRLVALCVIVGVLSKTSSFCAPAYGAVPNDVIGVVPVTLTFERAGEVEVGLHVGAAAADAPAHEHQ